MSWEQDDHQNEERLSTSAWTHAKGQDSAMVYAWPGADHILGSISQNFVISLTIFKLHMRK